MHSRRSSPGLRTTFFYREPPPTEISTLSLHDALPISPVAECPCFGTDPDIPGAVLIKPYHCVTGQAIARGVNRLGRDRKSTRLNSSHTVTSYAGFCLKKKKRHRRQHLLRAEQNDARQR